LRAILARHAVWASMRQTGGVIYVCADQDGCKRIAKHGADVGIAKGSGLRVELVDTIKAQAVAAYEEIRATRRSPRPAAAGPVLAVDGNLQGSRRRQAPATGANTRPTLTASG
jgi:hypothetical protein